MSKEITVQMEDLGRLIKDRSRQLEETLNQIEVYQQSITQLRQRIIQEEQKLRVILTPAYLTQNKERAVAEEQVRVCFHLTHKHLFLHSDCHSQQCN